MTFAARFIVTAFAFLLAGCVSPECCKSDSDWIALFDGKSTEAFRGYKRDSFPEQSWTIDNGTLKTIPGPNTVDLITKEAFDNFELQLEWKVSPGANSGIIYRVSESFPHSHNTGLEMQVLDDSKHKDGGNPKTSSGALYALIAPQNKKLNPVGEWNQARLIVNGFHVEHWVNGRKVVEYELESEELNNLIADSKFKKLTSFAKQRSGHIVLQHHRDEVWFRNIKIRRL